MIKLDVLRILENQGKIKYWLYKQLGMSYQNFNRMINNETKIKSNDDVQSRSKKIFLPYKNNYSCLTVLACYIKGD